MARIMATRTKAITDLQLEQRLLRAQLTELSRRLDSMVSELAFCRDVIDKMDMSLGNSAEYLVRIQMGER